MQEEEELIALISRDPPLSARQAAGKLKDEMLFKANALEGKLKDDLLFKALSLRDSKPPPTNARPPPVAIAPDYQVSLPLPLPLSLPLSPCLPLSPPALSVCMRAVSACASPASLHICCPKNTRSESDVAR
jgi:hypothetical protein